MIKSKSAIKSGKDLGVFEGFGDLGGLLIGFIATSFLNLIGAPALLFAPGPMECGLRNPARAGRQQRYFALHPPWSPWHFRFCCLAAAFPGKLNAAHRAQSKKRNLAPDQHVVSGHSEKVSAATL
jgi:hypothetical protein